MTDFDNLVKKYKILKAGELLIHEDEMGKSLNCSFI